MDFSEKGLKICKAIFNPSKQEALEYEILNASSTCVEIASVIYKKRKLKINVILASDRNPQLLRAAKWHNGYRQSMMG